MLRKSLALYIGLLINVPIGAGVVGADPSARPLLAQSGTCGEQPAAAIRVDQGNPWRPPFDLDRVGAPAVVHVELKAKHARNYGYYLVAYRNGQEAEHQPLNLVQNPTDQRSENEKSELFFANAPLMSLPQEVAIYARCNPNGSSKELIRIAVRWPDIQADAAARSNRQINPVDLGTILVPHGWLLLAGGQTALVDVAAISYHRDIPNARLRAWFEDGKPVESALPLAMNQRAAKELCHSPRQGSTKSYMWPSSTVTKSYGRRASTQ